MSKTQTKTPAHCRGTIHPERTLFLRHACGSATDKEGRKYDLTLNVSDMSPIVESGQTKKYFTLSWQDIIDLAVEKGVDD